jgi:hypothetical protein
VLRQALDTVEDQAVALAEDARHLLVGTRVERQAEGRHALPADVLTAFLASKRRYCGSCTSMSAGLPLMRQWHAAYPAGKHLSAVSVSEAFLAHLPGRRTS